MSALLNHNEIPIVLWKGQTFSQISSIIQKNQRSNTSVNSIFKAQPIAHYRREINTNDNCSHANQRTSVKWDSLNIPNGNVLNQINDGENPINIIEIKRDMPSCLDSNNQTCFSAEANAIAKVRSAGMFRKENDANSLRLSDSYSANYAQYLKNRNKNFEQNKNTKLNIGGECISTHKLNNSKYGAQGAISSSSRIERLKLDTVNKTAESMSTVYGQNTANAMKYRGSGQNVYTVKDKIGTLMPQTPVYYAGVMKTCTL